MQETVAQFIVQRLAEWGVRRVFGFSGDGINGLLGALDRASDQLEYIPCRHEEMAAFMACGHAKFTGEVGVCLATSGPGAVHLLNGLYDAKRDHQPVLAIVGQAPSTSLGGDYLQEVDLTSLFKDVASAFIHTLEQPAQARHLIDRALRIALSERTVTCILVPRDIQEREAVEEPPHTAGALHSGAGWSAPRTVPSDDDLDRAADVLNSGKRLAILAGAGALHATQELIAVAERRGAGVAKALLGKTAVPDTLPFVTGSIGHLGTRASWELMAGCDTLLVVGSGFPYAEFLPKEGQARAVQIDLSGRMLSIRYPMEVNLHGDAALTLRALLPRLEQPSDRSRQEQIIGAAGRWADTVRAGALKPARPLNPQRVFYELSPRLPDQCIIAGDSGSSTWWLARILAAREGMMMSVSGGMASMGNALPYAVAAKLAHPGRPVLAIAGDGAMQMNGLNELITVAQLAPRWSDGRFVVLVLNNGDLNLVSWEQRILSGQRKWTASQTVPDFSYARYAELLGLTGIRVDHPDQLTGALDRALGAGHPVLLEAVVDPTVPCIPSHLTDRELGHIRAVLKQQDDPERSDVIQQLKAHAPETASEQELLRTLASAGN